MINWFRKQIMALSMALSNVERYSITQSKESLDSGVNSIVDVNEGRLSNDILKGKVTKQVEEMRWRMYKILYHSRYKKTINDGDNVLVKNIDAKKQLDKIKTPANSGKVIMCINNRLETQSITDIEDVKESMTISEIETMFKSKRRLNITRELTPKFKIEDFTEKLIISEDNEDDFILDFYINKYPDIYDKRTPFLIKEIHNIKTTKKLLNTIDFKNVGFITNNDLGVDNLLEFLYDIKKFKEVLDFEGYYILRFNAEVLLNGIDVIKEFVDLELEKKYEKKARKK